MEAGHLRQGLGDQPACHGGRLPTALHLEHARRKKVPGRVGEGLGFQGLTVWFRVPARGEIWLLALKTSATLNPDPHVWVSNRDSRQTT